MKQTENKVKIEGILSEIDIEAGSFTKNGTNVESIGGVVKVKVQQQINGEDVTLEIPVHMFASKLTNKGTSNPAYESIEKIQKTFNSIAAVGEENADRVRFNINSGAIQMNEYYNTNGQLVSFPRISASFVQKVKKEDFKPEATFIAEMVVQSITMETDKDGIETGRCCVVGAIVQYGEKVDVIKFYTSNQNVINAIQNYWHPFDTVRTSGRLNFSSTTETFIEAVDFGEPIERQRTISISELVITGGSQTPMDGEFAIDKAEIEAGLAARLARLDSQKDKDTARAKTRQAPAASGSANPKDLGF